MTRSDIAKAARSYVGTPFRHQGRTKGLGLDCVGLVLCVADDLGLRDRFGVPILRSDYREYSSQPTSHAVHQECKNRLIEIRPEELDECDVVSMRVPDLPTHCAILTRRGAALYMIHAYEGNVNECVEHILSPAWRRRIVGTFRFPVIQTGGAE